MQRDSEGVFDAAIADPLIAQGMLPGHPSHFQPSSRKSDLPAYEVQGAKARRRADRRIDLGGIAKGFAVDRAVALWTKDLDGSGLVNAGGDLRVFGREAARIQLREGRAQRPHSKTRCLLLQSVALATSYGRSDKVIARTATLFSGNRTVSISARDCMTADALTKVALMASPATLADCLTKHRAQLVDLKDWPAQERQASSG